MTEDRAELPVIDLADLPDVLTLQEAAAVVGMDHRTLRRAIHRGELAAFLPRNRPALRVGRGQGYRIHRDDLTNWYFGL